MTAQTTCSHRGCVGRSTCRVPYYQRHRTANRDRRLAWQKGYRAGRKAALRSNDR
jgi:hypothetical protein